jgi:hypothetical protein
LLISTVRSCGWRKRRSCCGRTEPLDGLDILDRNEIRQLDQILDATDTYTDWLDGRPTPAARLAHAVETLSEVVRRAPNFADQVDQPDRTQWYRLLDLASDDLGQQAARERPSREIDFGR